MSLSRKIILASSVCAAFLAIGIGCSVEDRDIEKKDLFMCQKDEDCLSGSRCVKASESQAFGSCEREDDISHCVDNDQDGFYRETSKEYFNECGFSETNQRDPDDSNPAVKPGAVERCDGADNSADGCIDGTCKEDKKCGDRESDGTLKDGGSKCPPDMDCDGNNDDNCEPLVHLCWGAGDYRSFYKSACAADKIGVL